MSAPRGMDVVELKVTVSLEQARTAGIWDALPGSGHARRLWFCEPSGAHPTRLPLQDSGVTLRLGETRGHTDEATVRLCPCLRSRLTGRWSEPWHNARERLGFVSEWCGDRRMLSASVTARHPPGTVIPVASGGGPPDALFTYTQRQFLTECADRPVELNELTAFGPVIARRWPASMWSRMPLTVEHWALTAPSGARVDLVELSRHVDRQGAEIAQLALESGLRRRGVDPAECAEVPRTRRVLELLTAAAPAM
ncbi:hypothetical protein ACIBL6_17185 [Streptomyces sp. NPDC050400]|uniref:hypothetical protein n=1 Tax=Streptomyces sp. NPDC050400 TaxID=3365610 RepID=UPI0037A97A3A